MIYATITSIYSVTIRRQNADGTASLIPTDPANTDYQAYLAWIDDGNIATEWTPGE